MGRRLDPGYPAPTGPGPPDWWAPEGTELSPAGGSRGTKTDTWSTTQAWCFPLKEAAWKPVAPMLKARTNHASVALNGEIYAVGGKASLSTLPGAASCSLELARHLGGLWEPLDPATKPPHPHALPRDRRASTGLRDRRGSAPRSCPQESLSGVNQPHTEAPASPCHLLPGCPGARPHSQLQRNPGNGTTGESGEAWSCRQGWTVPSQNPDLGLPPGVTPP